MSRTLFIKNIKLPVCLFCKHFEQTVLRMPTGKCVLFGEKDVVTDQILYYNARDCRVDEKKCGMNAIHFKEVEPK
jgi:hypothetical protein